MTQPHNVSPCNVLSQNTVLYRISSFPIQTVMLYKTTLYIIVSPILSLSQLLQCFNLQLILLQCERSRGVNWVKDREDYLSLCRCQPLSLTGSVRVAIWLLYSTAGLSPEKGKRKRKLRGDGRSITLRTQDFTRLQIKRRPFRQNQKDDTGDCKLCSQLPPLLNPPLTL